MKQTRPPKHSEVALPFLLSSILPTLLSMYSVPLSLLLNWCLLFILFFLDETPMSILTMIKTNHTFDEIVVREFLVRFWRVLYSQLSIKDEARLCSSTLDEFLECRLILAQRNDTGLYGLRLQPRFTEWDFENAFLQSWSSATCDHMASVFSLVGRTMTKER